MPGAAELVDHALDELILMHLEFPRRLQRMAIKKIQKILSLLERLCTQCCLFYMYLTTVTLNIFDNLNNYVDGLLRPNSNQFQ